MKIKVIFSILVLGFMVTNLSVKADDLSKCKKVFDGKCYEYYDTSNSITDKKCKTMQNGVCTEYFDVSVSNNNYVQEKTDMRELNKKEEQKISKNIFGFGYVLDPYVMTWSSRITKIYITEIIPNTSAEKQGLKIGDEILKLNGMKIRKISHDEFSNYLDGVSTINLEVKTVTGQKKYITLNKTLIYKKQIVEPFFDTYWGQICPYNLEEVEENLTPIWRMSRNLTETAKNEYTIIQNEFNWWLNKRNQFRNGFNLCLANNYNKQDVNSCLGQLVNRTLTTISQEQNLEMQRSALQAQQQMQQQQVNAINNYSNALRNQHVQVDANVYHSGTVNVNSNVNVNGNYTYRY